MYPSKLTIATDSVAVIQANNNNGGACRLLSHFVAKYHELMQQKWHYSSTSCVERMDYDGEITADKKQ